MFYIAENDKDAKQYLLDKSEKFEKIEQADYAVRERYKNGFRKKLVICEVVKEYESSPIKIVARVHKESKSICITDKEKILYNDEKTLLKELNDDVFNYTMNYLKEHQDIVHIVEVETPVILYEVNRINRQIADLEREKRKLERKQRNFVNTFGVEE